MLVGSILTVRGSEVVKVAVLYAAIGLFHWLCRRPFFLISTDPDAAYREGWRVRGWDFLFYASFGVVVTSSVRIAGVLLVFAYLIVPALAGHRPGRRVVTPAPDRLGLRYTGERGGDARLGDARPADGRDGGLRVRRHPARAGRLVSSRAGAGTERRRARAARGEPVSGGR